MTVPPFLVINLAFKYCLEVAIWIGEMIIFCGEKNRKERKKQTVKKNLKLYLIRQLYVNNVKNDTLYICNTVNFKLQHVF